MKERSLILLTATRFTLPLLLLFAVFLLLRGHNAPGGGFIAGLVAAASVALYALSMGVPASRTLLMLEPRLWIGAGLLLALASGAAGLTAGEAFFKGLWLEGRVTGLGTLHVGTPTLFDLGVFLLVLGVTSLVVLSLAEEQEE